MQSTKEKLGTFYLGKVYNPTKNAVENKPVLYDSKDLTTHAVCLGMTGSGKTGLGIGLLEDAALSGIPSIIIDPKGDMGNLALQFPNMLASDFQPWIDDAEASRQGISTQQYAENIAKQWKEGLATWDITPATIKKLHDSVDIAIYTPANNAGIPLSILNSFSAPPDEILKDEGALRDRILSTVSSLLGLVGVNADPINSREHILISTILDKAWRNKQNLDLPTLIQQIQKPPFAKVGVFDTDSFYSQKDRLALAMKLNNLLASPGFQSWMQGEPLDIQNLFYTKEGKPRLAILTIAHLSDVERMFFVTLLLNELLAWMRRQTGTTNLRALLYMDEIFGFFPPTSMPPSKTPMLTLLKQARAFGLGIVLATQNPVDLDYKGLSNCGTWFIGKLQTERDKSRVLDGLSLASNGDINTAEMNKMIAACGSRVFILRSVHLKDPILFRTRWTISYLRGPLTLPQIKTLMQGRYQEAVSEPSVAQAGKPSAPAGIQEYYQIPANKPANLKLRAKVLGIAKLHFVDTKNKIDTWKQYVIAGPVVDDADTVLWQESEDITAEYDKLSKTPPANATFEELPPGMIQSKNYSNFNKSFCEYLYQNQTLDIFEFKDGKLTSTPDETEQQFRDRIAESLKSKIQDETKKIQEAFDKKQKGLQDKLQKATYKVSVMRSQLGRQWLDTILSALTAFLGVFMGKRLTKGAINQAGTSVRKATRIEKDQKQTSIANETVEQINQDIQKNQEDLDQAISDINAKYDASKAALDTLTIRPRKSDIAIESIGIVWIPIP